MLPSRQMHREKQQVRELLIQKRRMLSADERKELSESILSQLERMTIFQALAMTGDLMTSGDRRHVRIIRPRGNAEPEVLEFDIRTNTIIDSKYYYVYPNDLIYVSREPGSFYKQTSYSGFLALITSSVSLLITVLNYIPGVWN
jgi:hypothetical protein